jgi:hypothetical protein
VIPVGGHHIWRRPGFARLNRRLVGVSRGGRLFLFGWLMRLRLREWVAFVQIIVNLDPQVGVVGRRPATAGPQAQADVLKRTRNSRGLDEAAWGRISSGSDEIAGQPQRGEIRQPRATSPGYDATIKAKSPNGARFQFAEPL